jgi:hypothetical protein
LNNAYSLTPLSLTVSHNNTFAGNKGRLAIVAMRQLPHGFFYKNALHFKDIFRAFEAF